MMIELSRPRARTGRYAPVVVLVLCIRVIVQLRPRDLRGARDRRPDRAAQDLHGGCCSDALRSCRVQAPVGRIRTAITRDPIRQMIE